MYFGVNGFVIRLSIAVQNLVISVILGAAGFIEGQAGGVQPAAVIPALRVLMTWVPWVALALALVAAYLHKLDGPRLEEVKRRLGELQRTQASVRTRP
jgi:GPH family glycoside/pentoside/hexuronide:cation symporter